MRRVDDGGKPAPPSAQEGEKPEIYAVKKGKEGVSLSRRSFLGALAAAGSLTAGCVPGMGSIWPNGPFGGKSVNCGPVPAHREYVRNLLTIGDTLFSWTEMELKAWSWSNGGLIKRLGRGITGFEITTNNDPFPILFNGLAPVLARQAYSADGGTLASIRDPSKGEVAVWIGKGGPSDRIHVIGSAERKVTRVALSPDGKTMALGRERGTMEIWSRGGSKPLRTLQDEDGAESLALAVAPGNDLLLSLTALGFLKIWSLSEGKLLKAVKLAQDPKFGDVAITPNEDLAAVRCDHEVTLLSLPGGEEKGKIPPGRHAASSVSFSPDGRRLAVSDAGGAVNIWDVQTASLTGCMSDPALSAQGEAKASQGRVMGYQTGTLPCGTPLPAGAICLCDCVEASHAYRSSTMVCTCDTISFPAGRLGAGVICVCDTIAVPSALPPKCACDSYSPPVQSHYWRPD